MENHVEQLVRYVESGEQREGTVVGSDAHHTIRVPKLRTFLQKAQRLSGTAAATAVVGAGTWTGHGAVHSEVAQAVYLSAGMMVDAVRQLGRVTRTAVADAAAARRVIVVVPSMPHSEGDQQLPAPPAAA